MLQIARDGGERVGDRDARIILVVVVLIRVERRLVRRQLAQREPQLRVLALAELGQLRKQGQLALPKTVAVLAGGGAGLATTAGGEGDRSQT